MKKWLKWLLGIASVLVLVIVGGVVWWWPEFTILFSADKMDGRMETIPVTTAAEITPLTKGPADWTCWRGSNRDGRSAITDIRKDWSSGLKKIWEIDYLCQGKKAATWSAPVVQGNRLVVCGRSQDEDLIFCLNPDSGAIIWKAAYKASAKKDYGEGSRATPCIDDDRVYTFGRSGDLICFSLLDGKTLWRSNVGDEGGKEPQWGHSASPLVMEGLVVVQGGGTALVIAYDKFTGKTAWKSGKGIAGYAALNSMDIEGTPAILSFHGKGLAAMALPTGAALWDVPWKTDYDVNATTPIVSGKSVFITSGYETGGALVKVDGNHAKIAWQNKEFASQHSDPYIIDGFIYGYSGQSFQNDGAFKCVKLDTGKEVWSSDTIGWGTCTFVDGLLLCCDIRGNLALVKPDPQKFTMITGLKNALGKIRGPVWTVPVVANGKLYLRFKQKLVCYDIVSS